jgi:hypothetical protein
MKTNTLTEEQIKASNKAKTFGISFIFTLVAAVNLGFFLSDPSITASNGAFYGFLTGFGWVLPAFAVVAMVTHQRFLLGSFFHCNGIDTRSMEVRYRTELFTFSTLFTLNSIWFLLAIHMTSVYFSNGNNNSHT